MPISLKDIAQKANLSIATVSRALRNCKEISPHTRQLVQQIAEKLRYRPNQLARSILTGQTKTVGVIFPKGAQKTDFCTQMLLGIHHELGYADYHAICIWSESTESHNGDMQIAAKIHSLIDKRVDGFIVNPTLDARETYIREIIERKIPIVAIDIDLFSPHCDFVGTDDFYGAYHATEYLLNLGHRKILHISGPKTSSTAAIRKEAFLQANTAFHNSDYTLAEDPFFGTDHSVSTDIAYHTLSIQPRPTAIFCANDYIAAAVYKAAHRKGLSIPTDLSVLGFADMEFCVLLDPPLTTVRQNPFQIGAVAAKLLIEHTIAQKHRPETKRILLRPELVIRESVMIKTTPS